MNQISRINFEPDLLVLDGQHLDKLINLFLSEQMRKNSPSTVRVYRNDFARFLTWWQVAGPPRDWMLDESAMLEFRRYLETVQTRLGGPLSWNSRHENLSLLRNLFRWAHRHSYLSSDFGMLVPKMKGKPPTQPPVTLNVLAALLEAAAAPNTRNQRRNQAIIATFAGTGIRCQECAALQLGDVTFRANETGFMRLRVTKGDRPRLVAFDKHTGHYLYLWSAGRVEEPNTAPLFTSERGGFIQPVSIYRIIRRCAEKAGVGHQIRGPHDLRRMFATHWSRHRPGQGYGALLQKQLGHASFNTTTQYMLQDIEDVMNVMSEEDVSPMAALAVK